MKKRHNFLWVITAMVLVAFAFSKEFLPATHPDNTLSNTLAGTSAADATNLHFINVGQGDAELIVCGEDAVLIDGGKASAGSTVVDYLSRQGIAELDAVIAPRDKSVGITETVLRVSVGAAEKVPFIQVTNLARTMKQLQSRGIWIFGTSDKGDRGLYETDFTGPAALVMGAEGEGMRRLTEENCDFLLRIPMKGSIPCLNVSVATGVCLYEMVRQRS